MSKTIISARESLRERERPVTSKGQVQHRRTDAEERTQVMGMRSSITRTQTNVSRFKIETLAKARERIFTRVEKLDAHVPAIAEAINDCDGASESCLELTCAVCARARRIKLTEQFLNLAESYKGEHRMLTIFLKESGRGSLAGMDVKRAHDALRKRFNRAGFQGAILAGGTEVAWKQSEERWILHVHLLAIGVSDETWTRFLENLPAKHATNLGQSDPFEKTEKQASYLQKFGTYHRPGKQTGPRRPRAYPLPTDRFVELARWWTDYSFEECLFLYGARRRGGRIVPER
jgi:hypothetical protein